MNKQKTLLEEHFLDILTVVAVLASFVIIAALIAFAMWLDTGCPS